MHRCNQPVNKTTQPIRRHVKGRQHSGNFGRDRPILGKMGAESGRARVFMCGKADDLSATSQQPISTKLGRETYFRVPSRNPERYFRNFFILGDICPQNRKSVKQAPHSEQATGHGMHCREILLTARCSTGASEFPMFGQRFVRRSLRLRSCGESKLPNFRILAYFPHK